MAHLYIFDMGGVVSEHCFVWKQICEAMQLAPPETTDSRGSYQKLENAIMRGDITSMEMLQLLAARTGRPVPAENYWSTFFAPELHKPTVALIQALRSSGNRVVCGSNTIDAHYEYHMAHHQYDCFDAVYASHLIGQIKPDVAFWHYIRDAENALLEAAGKDDRYAFSDILFFDDMQKNVAAAASLGIHAHQFITAEKARAFVESVTGCALPAASESA